MQLVNDEIIERGCRVARVVPRKTGPPDDDEDEIGVDEPAPAPAPDKPIRIAVVGRPNAGKSTLINRLLGEERLLTGPEAGLTRDAITVPLAWHGRHFLVHDTAGLRRRFGGLDKLAAHEVAAHLTGGLLLAPPLPALAGNTTLIAMAAVPPS